MNITPPHKTQRGLTCLCSHGDPWSRPVPLTAQRHQQPAQVPQLRRGDINPFASWADAYGFQLGQEGPRQGFPGPGIFPVHGQGSSHPRGHPSPSDSSEGNGDLERF